MLQAFLQALTEMSTSIISNLLGVNLKDIKKSLDKAKFGNSENSNIGENIDAVSKKLEDSKEIIENALLEMEKQKRLFEELKKEAEISQQISSMNEEQMTALNNLLETTLNKQEKKSFPKTIL